MHPEEISGKKILFSPLNWGYGHVSRSIGLIHQLLEQGNVVIVACDTNQECVYREYFPEIVYEHHEGYPFRFLGKGQFARDLLMRFSSLRNRMRKETNEVALLCRKHHPDLIISDHRYGFYSKHHVSVFVTHQYNLPVKWYQAPVDIYHKKRMRRFKEVWIMDTTDSRLARGLSVSLEAQHAIYIGHYSRFSLYDRNVEKTIDKLAVISGPEVYAQQLADWVVKEHPDATVICDESIRLPKTIVRISGSWKHRDAEILKAKCIISRSGYSTLMDVEFLKVPCIFVPTIGQAEQIYLAENFKDSD